MARLYVSEALLRCCGRPQRSYSLKAAKKVLDTKRLGHILALRDLKRTDLPEIPRIFSRPEYEVGFFYLDTLCCWFILRGSKYTIKAPLMDRKGEEVYPHFIHNHPGNRSDFLPSMNDLDSISGTEIVTSVKGISLYHRMRARTRATGLRIDSPTFSRRYHLDYLNWKRNYMLFHIDGLQPQKFSITVFGMNDHHSRMIDFIPWTQFERFTEKLTMWDLLNRHLS